jgi:rhamnosyltransferase subunit B
MDRESLISDPPPKCVGRMQAFKLGMVQYMNSGRAPSGQCGLRRRTLSSLNFSLAEWPSESAERAHSMATTGQNNGRCMLSKRIVLATCGTLGDLRPYIAVAQALQARGHSVALGSSESYRDLVCAARVEFFALSPNLAGFYSDPVLQKKALRPLRGTEFIIRKIVLPALSESYEDLFEAARNADLIVGHFLAYAVPLVAEKLRIPWLQVYLHPMNLLSRYDPPTISNSKVGMSISSMMPGMVQLGYRAAASLTSSWMKPVEQLRKSVGLPPSRYHPLMESSSRYGTMGWFPQALVAPQPDWPSNLSITGYPFLKGENGEPVIRNDELDHFLRERRPIIFTLGSTAVLQPDAFYTISSEVSQKLGVAALLIGASSQGRDSERRYSSDVRTISYLPYDYAFPFSRVVVHHGGMGSIAQALRAGKQMLVVPFAWDQPDNAERIRRMGTGSVISRSKYRPEVVYRTLRRMINDQDAELKARSLGAAVSCEAGVENAADFIETALLRNLS